MKLLTTEEKNYCDFLLEIEENFIEDERRDRKEALEIINEKEYTVYSIYDESLCVGFITVWELSDFAFIEHFVIKKDFRNRGYGKAVIELIKKKFTRVILEAELPKSDIQKRRICFYERCGFLQNSFDYLQPSYREGGQKVPLVLMSFPSLLGAPTDVVREIYERVYKEKYI